ncbi:MAG: Ig-like domain-containing protein [Gemmatimonadota bacterium]
MRLKWGGGAGGLAAALLLSACAQASVPPGGPPDDEPPQLLRIRPDSNSVNVRDGAVAFEFDEVVSERPQGAQSLAQLFLISPSEGVPQLSWRRTRVAVRPRGGFRPNTTYSITLLPGMVDLDGNIDSSGAKVVFSTGSTVASGRIAGRIFDWMAERPAAQAYVEAVSLPDSARYLAYSDSLGEFEVGHLPPGLFLVRALIDPNRNRQLDPRELHDTATVQLADSITLALHAIVRDTLGPGLEGVDVVDSLTLRLRFDRVLDTAMTIAPAGFTLKQADSTSLPIASAVGGRAWQKAREDSAFVRATRDSVRARAIADSVARADSIAGRPQPPARPAPEEVRPPARPATPDSVRPIPRPSVRIPEREVILTLGAPLRAATAFRVRAIDARSIVGRSRSSERQFSTPRARPPADTASAGAHRLAIGMSGGARRGVQDR